MYKFDTQGNLIKEKFIEGFSEFKYTINNVFDQVYLINLEKDTDKFERMNHILNTLNIKFKLINAIDAYKIPEPKNKWTHRGAYGCKLSHLLALNDAKKNKYNKILILEDDLIFTKNFNNLFHNYYGLLMKQHKDWKMLFLGCSFHEKHPDFNSEKKLIKSKKSLGAFAVGIDCELLDIILKFEKDNRAIDTIYQQEIEDKVKSFVCNPMLITAKVDKVSNTCGFINNQDVYLKKNNLNRNNFDFDYNPKSNFIFNIPIYWINLDRSVKRRKIFTKKVKDLNIYQNKRIPAIDGSNLSNYDFNIPIKYTLTTSNNEIACCLSHLKAVSTAYYNKEEYVIICEDDVCLDLLKYSDITFEKIINTAPKNWEIIQLSTSNPKQVDKLSKSEKEFEVWDPLNWGSYCYLINRKGIKKLVNKFTKNKIFNIPNDIDSKIVADLIIYNYCNSYSLTKGIVTYNDDESTLHNNHLNFHQKGKKKLLIQYGLKELCKKI